MQIQSVLRVLAFSPIFLVSCITAPIEEVRNQDYMQMEMVLQLTMEEVEEALIYYYARCGEGHWLKPAREGENREMVFTRQYVARKIIVDGWMEFEPMGAGSSTLVKMHATRKALPEVRMYLSIIQDPTYCRNAQSR